MLNYLPKYLCYQLLTFFREFIERHLLERESENKKNNSDCDYDKVFPLEEKFEDTKGAIRIRILRRTVNTNIKMKKMSCVLHNIT